MTLRAPTDASQTQLSVRKEDLFIQIFGSEQD